MENLGVSSGILPVNPNLPLNILREEDDAFRLALESKFGKEEVSKIVDLVLDGEKRN